MDFDKMLNIESIDIWKLLFQAIGVLTSLLVGLKFIYKKIYAYAIAMKSRFWAPFEMKEYLDHYVETKCQDTPPTVFDEPRDGIGQINRMSLIDFFINEVFSQNRAKHKHYLILADSGMGKTTFLVNLFYRYKKLWKFNKKQMVLIPFNRIDTDQAIQKITSIQKQRKTIILLDGLDEDLEAATNYENRISQILKWTQNYHRIILTCRVQFYSSVELEPYDTGINSIGRDKYRYLFVKKYVSPFDDSEVDKYIRMKFSVFKPGLRKRAREIVNKCPDLLSRPMILSYIEYLVVRSISGHTAYSIYNEMIYQWIRRESLRYGSRSAAQMEMLLYKFSTEIAAYIYRSNSASNSIGIEQMNDFARGNNINLSLFEMKSKSLLTRNLSNEYKFAHKSIYEFFLMRAIFNNDEQINFIGLDQCKKFLDERRFEETDGVRIAGFINKRLTNIIALHKVENKDAELINSQPDSSVIYEVNDRKYLHGTNSQVDLKLIQSATSLGLDGFAIDDISPFESLHNLRRLDLRNNAIGYVGKLCMLNLEELHLSGNPLLRIKNLRLPKLRRLSLAYTMVEALDDLGELPALTDIVLTGTKMTTGEMKLYSERYKCNIIHNNGESSSTYKIEGGYGTSWYSIIR